MSTRIRFLPFICILSCFTFFGLTGRIFACDPFNYNWTTPWNIDFKYFCRAEDASAYLIAKGYGSGSPSAHGEWTCLHINVGIAPTGTQYFACYCNAADFSSCGNSIPNAPSCNCVGACSDLESRLSSECSGPGTYEFNAEECTGHCYPLSQCAQAYEDACLRCGVTIGGLCRISYFDNTTCMAVCSDCNDEYEQKKQECENPWLVDEDTCSCTDIILQAEAACPFGFSMQPNCSYTCLPCSELEKQCISQCNGKENVDMYFCEDVNGKPKDHLCQCKQDTCDEFYDSCHAACDTPECGGIKVSKCTASGGEITYSRCECNGCSKPPENPDGPPPSDGPTDEPGDGSDIIAWLKAIKGDTGTLVEQGNDHTAWFSSIKKNGDRTNQLLEYIAGKNTSVDVNVDTSSVVNAIGITNQKLGDANQKLGGIGGTLTDIKDGLSGLNIGTKTADGDYSVSEGNYGSAPTTADLPDADTMKSSFGTYTPAEYSNRDLIKSTIYDFVLGVSSTDCNPVLSLPVPTLSGLVWHDYPLNFCQYASLISMVGNVLVFLTALYELYRLA